MNKSAVLYLCGIHKPIECGAGKQHEASTRSYFQLLQGKDVNINAHSLVNETLWIIILGTKYKVGAVVQHGFLHLLPTFSVIKKIVVVDGELNSCFFILERLHTIEFNEHYHAYKVEKPIDISLGICTQEELVSFMPMHYTNPVNSNGSFVNIKYDVDLYQHE
ncbi:uncharacterized protein LOC114543227 [Dendronephthya gigantea]|uniref:uncharacterized protein LOC114543227 n=1 Tax=Dendronephthya gigantea TaxID=151771 RepID=UPI00106A4A06|nr:uncharacterized protein LOC114543227 [Dendronephthya gigantea]